MASTPRVFAYIALAGLLIFGGSIPDARADIRTPSDMAARDLVEASEREDWASVNLYAGRINDPLLAAYATWLRLQQENSTRHSVKSRPLSTSTRPGHVNAS